jgi:GntR family transcriptional repressor for pyruvate dehydrogenase complex
MPPVRRRNLSHSIAESLLDRIRAGEVGVGDRLPTEQGLMEEFGVGRNVIREAIQQLVAIGVLDVRPGRGTTVIGLGSDDLLDARTMSALLEDQTIADLYAFRMLIEVEIAEAAASHATAQQIQTIADAHLEYERNLAAGQPVYRSDLSFHRAVALASNNQIYVRVLDALSDLLEASRERTDHVPGAPERAAEQHGVILEAIRRGDGMAAREEMRQHIRRAIEVIEMMQAGATTG